MGLPQELQVLLYMDAPYVHPENIIALLETELYVLTSPHAQLQVSVVLRELVIVLRDTRKFFF